LPPIPFKKAADMKRFHDALRSAGLAE